MLGRNLVIVRSSSFAARENPAPDADSGMSRAYVFGDVVSSFCSF